MALLENKAAGGRRASRSGRPSVTILTAATMVLLIIWTFRDGAPDASAEVVLVALGIDAQTFLPVALPNLTPAADSGFADVLARAVLPEHGAVPSEEPESELPHESEDLPIFVPVESAPAPHWVRGEMPAFALTFSSAPAPPLEIATQPTDDEKPSDAPPLPAAAVTEPPPESAPQRQIDAPEVSAPVMRPASKPETNFEIPESETPQAFGLAPKREPVPAHPTLPTSGPAPQPAPNLAPTVADAPEAPTNVIAAPPPELEQAPPPKLEQTEARLRQPDSAVPDSPPQPLPTPVPTLTSTTRRTVAAPGPEPRLEEIEIPQFTSAERAEVPAAIPHSPAPFTADRHSYPAAPETAIPTPPPQGTTPATRPAAPPATPAPAPPEHEAFRLVAAHASERPETVPQINVVHTTHPEVSAATQRLDARPPEPVSAPAAVWIDRTPEERPASATPLRDLTVQIESPNSEEVIAVRFTQTREHIEVGVKASQPQVAESLRQDLPELVDGLRREGFRTELFATPASRSVHDTVVLRESEVQTGEHRHNRKDVEDWTDQRQRRYRPQQEGESDEQ